MEVFILYHPERAPEGGGVVVRVDGGVHAEFVGATYLQVVQFFSFTRGKPFLPRC